MSMVDQQENVCMKPGCGHEEHSRGVCLTHYSQLRRLKESGRFTDEQMVDFGWWLVTRRPGRKPSFVFGDKETANGR
jgi:hypothetical protein